MKTRKNDLDCSKLFPDLGQEEFEPKYTLRTKSPFLLPNLLTKAKKNAKEDSKSFISNTYTLNPAKKVISTRFSMQSKASNGLNLDRLDVSGDCKLSLDLAYQDSSLAPFKDWKALAKINEKGQTKVFVQYKPSLITPPALSLAIQQLQLGFDIQQRQLVLLDVAVSPLLNLSYRHLEGCEVELLQVTDTGDSRQPSADSKQTLEKDDAIISAASAISATAIATNSLAAGYTYAKKAQPASYYLAYHTKTSYPFSSSSSQPSTSPTCLLSSQLSYQSTTSSPSMLSLDLAATIPSPQFSSSASSSPPSSSPSSSFTSGSCYRLAAIIQTKLPTSSLPSPSNLQLSSLTFGQLSCPPLPSPPSDVVSSDESSPAPPPFPSPSSVSVSSWQYLLGFSNSSSLLSSCFLAWQYSCPPLPSSPAGLSSSSSLLLPPGSIFSGKLSCLRKEDKKIPSATLLSSCQLLLALQLPPLLLDKSSSKNSSLPYKIRGLWQQDLHRMTPSSLLPTKISCLWRYTEGGEKKNRRKKERKQDNSKTTGESSSPFELSFLVEVDISPAICSKSRFGLSLALG